ncbi:MAG: AAA family ATPase, partial [Candidatus Aminicenantes bacterium]|nr:AAA family ATPase [Candidatus Aminicenantes bacterium]
MGYYKFMMNETLRLKKIPYGVSDFNDFRVKNLYYVDKTRFIRDIEEKGSYLFLIRPRRFGKSLFLAILEAYYDIALKDRFDSLFSGTDIHRNPTAEKNSYLVFKLNFSTVEPDLSQVEDAFLTLIKNTAGSFVSKYEKLLGIDIKETKTGFDSLKSASDV